MALPAGDVGRRGAKQTAAAELAAAGVRRDEPVPLPLRRDARRRRRGACAPTGVGCSTARHGRIMANAACAGSTCAYAAARRTTLPPSDAWPLPDLDGRWHWHFARLAARRNAVSHRRLPFRMVLSRLTDTCTERRCARVACVPPADITATSLPGQRSKLPAWRKTQRAASACRGARLPHSHINRLPLACHAPPLYAEGGGPAAR